MLFAIYIFGNALAALIFVPFINRKFPNRLLLRCSACGSKLYQRPITRRWIFADSMAWALVAWIVIWRNPLPTGILITFFLILVLAWNSIVRHLVHAYWMWRHPFRCQDGGHVQPVPQSI